MRGRPTGWPARACVVNAPSQPGDPPTRQHGGWLGQLLTVPSQGGSPSIALAHTTYSTLARAQLTPRVGYPPPHTTLRGSAHTSEASLEPQDHIGTSCTYSLALTYMPLTGLLTWVACFPAARTCMLAPTYMPLTWLPCFPAACACMLAPKYMPLTWLPCFPGPYVHAPHLAPLLPCCLRLYAGPYVHAPHLAPLLPCCPHLYAGPGVSAYSTRCC